MPTAELPLIAVDIRRFGIGHRRSEGPAGTHGVEGQSIHADDRGAIAEVAFRPRAAIAAHSNPNLTYFLVIEGGGFVQVGDERTRVAAGEAVVWPPNVLHAAWTEDTPMRALVVEFAAEGRLGPGESGPHSADSAAVSVEKDGMTPGSIEGSVVRLTPDEPAAHDSADHEPW